MLSDAKFITDTMNGDLDSLKDLAKKIDVLGNDVRLKLLIIIGAESKKKHENRGLTDVRELTSILKRKFDIGMSETGVRKHLNFLLNAGFIKREPGSAERSSRGERAVMNYVLVKGALEGVNKEINQLTNQIANITEEMAESDFSYPFVKVLGGKDDGKTVSLMKDEVLLGRIGRLDPEDPEYREDVTLSNSYQSVTRITQPHAILTHEKGEWYLKDNESKGGVFVDNEKLTDDKIKLKDSDIIKLALGEGGAELVFISNN